MLAAALTAHSKLEPGPSPRWPAARVSSSRVAVLCQGRSSRRTMSLPARAVDRQCTLRRSSPCRYSRVAASSSPRTATARATLSPPACHAPDRLTDGSGCTTGTTVSRSVAVKLRVSSTSPNGSVSRSRSGPTRYRPRTSERTGYRTRRGVPGRIRSSMKRGRPPSV